MDHTEFARFKATQWLEERPVKDRPSTKVFFEFSEGTTLYLKQQRSEDKYEAINRGQPEPVLLEDVQTGKTYNLSLFIDDDGRIGFDESWLKFCKDRKLKGCRLECLGLYIAGKKPTDRIVFCTSVLYSGERPPPEELNLPPRSTPWALQIDSSSDSENEMTDDKLEFARFKAKQWLVEEPVNDRPSTKVFFEFSMRTALYLKHQISKDKYNAIYGGIPEPVLLEDVQTGNTYDLYLFVDDDKGMGFDESWLKFCRDRELKGCWLECLGLYIPRRKPADRIVFYISVLYSDERKPPPELNLPPRYTRDWQSDTSSDSETLEMIDEKVQPRCAPRNRQTDSSSDSDHELILEGISFGRDYTSSDSDSF